ncbi:hypothetical protein FGB62_134g011 [Gracilaria domingensis]|nr:hypothetical protein FGB62_134g011 [Gracilaria domingensis]
MVQSGRIKSGPWIWLEGYRGSFSRRGGNTYLSSVKRDWSSIEEYGRVNILCVRRMIEHCIKGDRTYALRKFCNCLSGLHYQLNLDSGLTEYDAVDGTAALQF